MRKKSTSPKPRCGRPPKTTQPAPRAAKKKRRRPPRAATARASAKADARAIGPTSHGLGRWKPTKGDVLITQSAGSFVLGPHAWRKAAPAYEWRKAAPAYEAPPLVKAAPAGRGRQAAEQSRAAAEPPVRKRRGRPPKGKPSQKEPIGQVVDLRLADDPAAIDRQIEEDIDTLSRSIRQLTDRKAKRQA